jgi:putative type IV pilin
MKRNKKGFTIVELVIVIAVIAILAAVLIPTFSSLIRRANETFDISLAKNMNTMLKMETGDEPEDMYDVLYIMDQNGFKVENLNPRTDGNFFVWDQKNNQIIYLTKEGKVIFAQEAYSKDQVLDEADKKGMWMTIKSAPTAEMQGYCYYFAANISVDFTASASVDTGVYRLNGTLTVTGDSKVKGTIENMIVDAPEAEVYNYSAVEEVTITRVKSSSYHEYGYVKKLKVASSAAPAHVVIENQGIVEELEFGSIAEGTQVTNKGYVVKVTEGSGFNATSEDFIADGGFVADTEGSSSIMVNDGNKGDGSSFKNNIATLTELENFRDNVNNGATYEGITVQLTADIALKGAWKPIGYDLRSNSSSNSYKCFSGTFDGNGHTISGLTNKGFTPTEFRKDVYEYADMDNAVFGLFGNTKNAVICNLNVTDVNIGDVSGETYALDSAAAIVGFASNGIEVTGCTVSGTIQGTDAVAGIVGRAYNSDNTKDILISDCTNNASVTCTGAKVAGILGFYDYQGSENRTCKVKISNCINNGEIKADNQTSGSKASCYAAGIAVLEASSDFAALVAENCTNNGNVTSVSAHGETTVSSIATRGGKSTDTSKGNWMITDCKNTGVISTATVVWDEKGIATTQQ